MKDYSGKYKYYTTTDNQNRKVTIAVSTYEGKTVKGYAKCDASDTYDVENGRELAAARCNARISKKRLNRASRKLAEAHERLAQAQAHLAKMVTYYNDSANAVNDAETAVTTILNNL